MYNASEGGSITGSFDHCVRRLRWLLPYHVKPDPVSLSNVPKVGLAMTFTQGAGVWVLGPRLIAYSRPSGVKPPRLLK